MRIALVQVPHDFERGAIAAGRGPLRYLDAGADRILREGRHDVRVTAVAADAAGLEAIEAVAVVDRALAAAVGSAVADRAWPLVLAGNCHSCLGTLAGLGAADLGIVWLDAHGDFNTPETSPSGYFDGMALAVAAGLSHDDLRLRIGARPVPGERVLLAGVRDLDPGERENLKRAGVQVVSGDAWRDVGPAASAAPLDRLAERVRDVYVHVDVDVVDPQEAPGVSYPTPGGPAPADVEALLVEVGRRFRVRAAALTAFNPDRDEGDRTLRVGLQLLAALAGAERAVE